MQDLASFEVGQRLKARVLAVDAGAKTVALSLLRHLVAHTSDCQLPQVHINGVCSCQCSITVSVSMMHLQSCVWHVQLCGSQSLF